LNQDRKVLTNIEKYGCHVIHVLPTKDGNHSPFAYSVGIEHSAGQPEIFVIGLAQPLAHFLVNLYCQRIREGEQFDHGQMVSGFLEGFECQFRRVHSSHYDDYFGQDVRFYGHSDFRVLQLIYPNTLGIWPWNPLADDWFRARQPLLDTPSEISP
jgi:hypothetical protein